MASSRKRNEFRFLISARVPNSACPTGRTETFASHRNEPSCMLPSQIPSHCTRLCRLLAYATASAARRNGRADGEAKTNCALHGAAVHHGQRARQRQIDGTGLRVRLCAELRGRARKNLGDGG